MAKETFSVIKDIFSVGMHNGEMYDEAVLDDMIKNFEKLKAESQNFAVPLKIDVFKYAKGEKFHGGVPSFGQVSRIFKQATDKGTKLFAEITNVPKKLKEIIENKGYRQVSIEMVQNFKHNTERLGSVLKAVALLGVEHPGCETLDDVWKFYEREAEQEEIAKVFVVEDNTPSQVKKEEKSMAMTVEQEKELLERVAQFDALKKELETLKTFVEQVKQEKEAALKKASELADGQRKAEIKGFVEAQEKEGHLLPKHKEIVLSFMESLDDSKTLKFTAEGKEQEVSQRKMFESLITALPKLIEFKEKTGEPGQEAGSKLDEQLKEFQAKDVKEFGEIEGQKLDFLTKKFMKDNSLTDYAEAYTKVKKMYPELTKKAE